MLNYSANGPSGYNINNSLRFRASATAYMTWLPVAAGNRKTWTLSFWMKAGDLATDNQTMFSTSQNYDRIGFQTSTNSREFVIVLGSSSANIATSQVFRDPSAWYHIVIAVDTTQATSTNRIKIYVNGTQVTSFVSTTYPSQNYDTGFGTSAYTQAIGRRQSTSNLYYDGYLTETNFIDGQALTPSSFGNTNSVTSVWQPAKYTGTYGTNGFYLKFADTSAATAAAIGKDSSGNGNNWTPSGISVTAGVTYDAMIDSPTLTSATVANYAVINPLDFISANGTISSANLNWASSANSCGNRATIGATSGKWYWEAVGSSVTSGTIGGRFAFTGSDTIAVEQDKFGMYWHPTSGIARIVNGTNTYVTSAYTYTNSDVLALALDLDNNISYWYKNGVLQYTYDFSAYSTIGARVFFPYVWNASSGTPSWVYNFGQRPFSYTPPTGFVALNTFNLPSSTIPQGNKYMGVNTYTGTGATQTITNNQFFPDFTWIKSRSNATNNDLFTAVLSGDNYLKSNSTDGVVATTNAVTSFNSNGFTLGSDSNSIGVNINTNTYVAWQWLANGNSGTTMNTSGSITSYINANTTSGFSQVYWTGTAANGTLGHGLGIAPKFIITKCRGASTDWGVYHTSIGNTKALFLNRAIAADTSISYWNNTSPTSTVFSVGYGNDVNAATAMVAFCWAEIAGFSKFGSYTGNGSTDGNFVYLGFRPKFILFKNTSIAEGWQIRDTSRDTYNASQYELFPYSTSAEINSSARSPTTYLDILSNGFKLRSNNAELNNGTGTNVYIYAAFAENPFKNALAR
jgi:hypothetical protein